MKFSRNLMTHLDALTEALDDSGDDLATIFTVLADDLSADISSLTGLSITVPVGGQPVTITAMHTHTAVTSMLLPLTVVDGHLPPPTASAAQASLAVLADRAAIDQAIGFLIERGDPPELARAELRRRAAAVGASEAWVAQQILGSGPGPGPDPDAAQEAADRDERTG